MCQALKPPNCRETESRKEYVCYIPRADQIFDTVMKDNQLRLPNGHRIPLADQLKENYYR